MNIADSFRFFKTNIKDIYNFMNILIDTSELKALGNELIVGIINKFSYVREKIIEIIAEKITKFIYHKLQFSILKLKLKLLKYILIILLVKKY